MTDTIYLNHAGTSWPKPDCVNQAVAEAVQSAPTSWPARFAIARQSINDFFHIPDPSRLLLAPACTSALSIAVSDHAWFQGDCVLTSCMEHHALHRPLFKLTELGVDLEVMPRTKNEPIILEELENRLRRGGVKMVAVSAASNVTGELLPVQEIVDLAHDHGALVLIDAAQTAGWWDLDVPQLGADMFCFAGHKGPQAPWGIGGMFVGKEVCLNSLSSKCEVAEETEEQEWHGCSPMPTYCDAGSANIWAMIGMAAATNWLKSEAQKARLPQAQNLTQQLLVGLQTIPGVTIYGATDSQQRMPTVAFTHNRLRPNQIGQALKAKGIVVSYGLQCAPLAHRHLGTGPYGVVRLSCGSSNTVDQIEQTIVALQEILS
jgi:selenocysteine lyase/cysteine desulfurase